jgi:hypothetical protein
MMFIDLLDACCLQDQNTAIINYEAIGQIYPKNNGILE